MRPRQEQIDAVVERALEEDIGSGDVTTLATVESDRMATATLVAKEAGVIAGLEVCARVFENLDHTVRYVPRVEDGHRVRPGAVIATFDGQARALLTGERTALNLLQRMSGIATAANVMAEAAQPATLLDTRKTAPGLRMLDKWAVSLGGAANHRVGLYDMILIKENHIVASGGIVEAIQRAIAYRRVHALDVPIEIEVRNLGELDVVLGEGGVEWVLLDNMARMTDDGRIDCSLLRTAVQKVAGRFTTEASGNITLDTVGAVAATGVDFVSSGALTHSVRALDVSLLFDLGDVPD